ncbi:carbohydrate-binding protein [Bradyrhizobium japonicum]|uniref:carbohydrate-binding protein n=1 Tax=Bradyrhizobium japonicum TaxID=375 RepID=UPI002714D426|nr:carbohydrate-binding protein [Bradyrhizobium japonicum]WLB16175.1 hypothetical protein QIH95_29530 [Bradyrhizobium japonicum]
MTALVSYSTGTVSVAADGTIVTGVGPLWLTSANAKPGDIFQSGHFFTFITDVTSETTLVVPPWPGSTLSGATYNIWKISQQRIVGAEASEDMDKVLTALNTTGWFIFVPPAATAPDPSLGNDGQYAMQPTTGKQWVKVSGVWTYQGIYKAFRFLGAWSGATAYTIGDVVASGGNSYVCVLDHTNHVPPNVTYWQLLASVGAAGPVAWLPPAAWATAQSYVTGPPASVVTFNGSSYVCIVPHTSGTFATDLAAANWLLVAQRGQDGSNYAATSTTSLLISTGSKSFTTQANLAYTVGARVRLSRASDITKYMEGTVTAYNVGTGAMTVNVLSAVGSGTFTDWNLNIAGDPGSADFITVRKFLYNAIPGQVVFSNADSFGRTLSYTPGFITVVLNGSVLTPNDFTATDGTSVTLPRANSGDVVYIDCSLAYNPADALAATQNGADIPDKAKFRANIGVQKKNYIINGGMMVSQENGTTAVTTNAMFPVDQWFTSLSNDGVVSHQQVASATPGGSSNRIRCTVTTADTSISAAQYHLVGTKIEGFRVADLLMGSVAAKQITIQFGVKAPAGTYGVAIFNGAQDRWRVETYVIAAGEANTDVVKSVTFAGDTLGAWAKDNGTGLDVRWTLAVGSNFQIASGAWGSTPGYSNSAQFNLLGTNGNVFELFDVSLTEGSAAPAFQLPDFASELTLCQRYFYKIGSGIFWATGTLRSGGTQGYLYAKTPQPMRAQPTLSASSNQLWCADNNSGLSSLGIGGIDVSSGQIYLAPVATSSVGSVGQACMLYTASGSASFNARL